MPITKKNVTQISTIGLLKRFNPSKKFKITFLKLNYDQIDNYACGVEENNKLDTKLDKYRLGKFDIFFQIFLIRCYSNKKNFC